MNITFSENLRNVYFQTLTKDHENWKKPLEMKQELDHEQRNFYYEKKFVGWRNSPIRLLNRKFD